jgi:CubicO group peptidase (beta-lactamase class C family)
MNEGLTRREVISGAIKTTVAVGAANFFAYQIFAEQEISAAKQYKSAFEKLDQFIKQYLLEMNAPGMTLAVANRDGLLRATVYGFSNLDRKIAVQENQLFQIGSISKSFAALICLQLVEEGMLDLQKPVIDYLPWFRIQTEHPVTIHHLLTHSSGLPSDPPVFLSDPAARHEVGFTPGESFHYCNMGFASLGYLIAALDRTPWNESLRRRILQPLQMNDTEARITNANRWKMAENYFPFFDDRPYPWNGRLAQAPALVFDDAAGCIASTSRDMAKYMSLLLNQGAYGRERIISENSFAEFSKAHIKAEDFGPSAHYGYGIAVDSMDDHKILRHTGGMVSFMSAIHLDLDEGVGVFASINAQQGYRPNPVCVYGLKLLRAANAHQKLPDLPQQDEATKISDAKQYAGTFVAEDGSKLEFVAEKERLFLLYKESKLAVENCSSGMIVRHPDFQLFPLIFGREKQTDEKSPVTDVGHGEWFYMGARYKGQRHFDYPPEWQAYTGYYRNDSPWTLGFHILMRQGKLWVAGQYPFEPMNDGRFRDVSEPKSPEWISFHDIVNGKAMRIKYSGNDLWRVFV